MECTEVPSSQEAVVAASTLSSKRKKRPATSPPEVVAAEKHATGPHAHEQVVDANNNATVSEETFTVVKGRRGRRRDAHQAGEVERGSHPSRPRLRKVRLRPDAIVFKAAGTTTYADILRRLYAEPALQETVGKSVQCIRRSASGAMVLQLRKGVQNASTLVTELDGVLGDAATASALRHRTALEIRDLDECATKAEICTALGHQLGTTNLDPDVVRSLRKAYAGTQTAVIDLPDELAAEALKLGHLRVGWVSCRVRERAEASRCFRCWDFDHVAARCAGPDRSKLCYRCGQDGHRAKTCRYAPASCHLGPRRFAGAGSPIETPPLLHVGPCQRRVHLQRIRSTETLQRRVFRSAGKRGGGGPAQEAPHHCGRFQCLVDGVGQQRDETPRRRPPRRALCPGRGAADHRTHADLHRSAGQLHHRPLLRQRLAHSQSGGVAGGEGSLHEQRSPSHHLQPERTQASQKLGGPETEVVRPQAGCGGLLRVAVRCEDPERERDARAPGGHGGCSHHRHHQSLQRVDAQRGTAPSPPQARVLMDGRDRRSPAAVLAGSQTCPKSAGACRGGGSTRRFRHREEPTARCHRGEQAPLLERPLQ
ncbi:unnamed protein product [Trichogramma brassicae]|uniref:CCHC-type domain-containing protein n=1 Tax=Trichogramma brassicae TaxID=86971 RepID=A0A6H5J8W4_9HYME|nr:unnamed protein product [Trichogramma brassicae]